MRKKNFLSYPIKKFILKISSTDQIDDVFSITPVILQRGWIVADTEIKEFFVYLFYFCCAGSSLLLGLLSSRVCGLFILLASLVAEHKLQDAPVSVVAAHEPSRCGSWALEHKFNSCGALAELLRSRWDLPGSGIEPVSSALAGELPVKPGKGLFKCSLIKIPVAHFCRTR